MNEKLKNELHELIDSIQDTNFLKRLKRLIMVVLGDGD